MWLNRILEVIGVNEKLKGACLYFYPLLFNFHRVKVLIRHFIIRNETYHQTSGSKSRIF